MIYNAKSVFLVAKASWGWLNNVSVLILSFPTNQRRLKGNYDLNSAFENADILLGQKRTSS
jgi:hypothetical protein